MAQLISRAQTGSDAEMDRNLEPLIRRALAEARPAGKDYLMQTEEAVRAVVQAYPDMTASDVLHKYQVCI